MIVDSLAEDKAEDLVVIALGDRTSFADYMIVASGRSGRQIGAMAEHLITLLKEHGLGRIRPEGARQGDWVLVDAGDVIVHLFRPELRVFYNLEKMWSSPIEAFDRAVGAEA